MTVNVAGLRVKIVRRGALKNVAWLVVAIWPFTTVLAQDDFFDSIEVEAQAPSAEPEKTISLVGFVRQKFKYGWQQPEPRAGLARDSRGMSQMRTDIFAEVSGDMTDTVSWRVSGKTEVDFLRWQNGQADYGVDETRSFLKDAYVDAVFDNGTWLRAGHQLFAWGNSEGLAVTDIISPTDAREPGQAELRDIREHVPAVMLSLPLGRVKLSQVVTLDAGYDRLAQADEDFYFLAPAIVLGLPEATDYNVQTPKKSWEYAARLDYSFNGGDAALLAGIVNENMPSIIGVDPATNTLMLQQIRSAIVGLSINRVWGNWLVKTELASWRYDPQQDYPEARFDRYDEVRSMLAVEYSAWQNVTVTAEINGQFLNNDPPELATALGRPDQRNNYGGVIRLRQTALNERLTQQLWLLHLGGGNSGGNGNIVRWDTSWAWSDALSLGLGATLYKSADEDELLYAFRHNDSVSASLTWYF